jgi:hypothetical protein
MNSAMKQSKHPEEWGASSLIYRLFMAVFPGIHSAPVSCCSILHDLLSGPSAIELLDTIRQEVALLSKQGGDVWTVSKLNQAVLLDSAIKESLRLHTLNAIAPARIVSLAPSSTL